MGVFEVIRLIGVCVAFIVGTIVFMVLFFRGMSWIDFWVRGRRQADNKRKRPKRVTDSNKLLHSQEQHAAALGIRKPLPAKNAIASLTGKTSGDAKTLRWSNGIGSVHVSKRPSMAHAAKSDETIIDPASASPIHQQALGSEPATSHESVETIVEKGQPPKMVSRIATVHLLSGDTIERVAFCSKEKASKICDGLGFEGIVLEDSEGHICVVRESNIKMVTWKAL